LVKTYLFVCPSKWKNSAPASRVFVNSDARYFLIHLSRKVKIVNAPEVFGPSTQRVQRHLWANTDNRLPHTGR